MKMSRIYIVIFFTSAVCLFGVVIAEYIIPSEPFHHLGFGAEDISPDNATMMKYRILYRKDNVFYIGGRGVFHRIDPYNADCPIASLAPDIVIGTCETGGGALPCSSVAPIDKNVDCHNYIRIVQEYQQGGQDKVLVCGTNALEPRCYTFRFDAGECEFTLEFPSSGIGGDPGFLCDAEGSYDAKNLAPRNWNLNYSYWYSSESNQLFTGVSKSTDETDPIWAKYTVVETDLGTDTTPYDQKLDTYEIESSAVNQANFVGTPYEYEDENGNKFVLFFYRETAVEFINHGKIVYSRVGRVCRDDVGNSFKWSSFLKARLNCSLPNDYPAYFNEIQDVTTVTEGDETYFYSVLATPSNGVSSSALCRFRLSDIHDLFQNSKFKSPKSSKSLWLPVDPTDVPNPRPGSDCSNPSSNIAFIQNNPLLDDLVENYNPDIPEEGKSDAPLFYTDSGGRFSTIAVDARPGSTIDDNIYYIGTESGNVLKAYRESGEWTVFRYWQQENNEAITSLEFIPAESASKGPYLFATTDDSLTRIDLKYDKAQNTEQYNTVYFPYLNTASLPKSTGVIVESSPGVITSCDNRQINLFCEGRLDDPTSDEGSVTWYKNNVAITETQMGHLLRQTHLTGSLSRHPASFLTILALSGKSDDKYSCEVVYDNAPAEKERKEFTIMLEKCITDAAVECRKKEFDQVSTAAEYRNTKFAEGICEIQHPILCEQSCPYR